MKKLLLILLIFADAAIASCGIGGDELDETQSRVIYDFLKDKGGCNSNNTICAGQFDIGKDSIRTCCLNDGSSLTCCKTDNPFSELRCANWASIDKRTITPTPKREVSAPAAGSRPKNENELMIPSITAGVRGSLDEHRERPAQIPAIRGYMLAYSKTFLWAAQLDAGYKTEYDRQRSLNAAGQGMALAGGLIGTISSGLTAATSIEILTKLDSLIGQVEQCRSTFQ
jgi:hypothetical protein